MTRLLLSSDHHLGDKNIIKYRTQFSSNAEHDWTVFENLATELRPQDNLMLLGDVICSPEWLDRVRNLKCITKTLILGNHCTDRKVNIAQLLTVFDHIHSLHSRRNLLFSHCPVHPTSLRSKVGNVHGHDHEGLFQDPRYFNVCLEHHDYKPVTFAQIQETLQYS